MSAGNDREFIDHLQVKEFSENALDKMKERAKEIFKRVPSEDWDKLALELSTGFQIELLEYFKRVEEMRGDN